MLPMMGTAQSKPCGAQPFDFRCSLGHTAISFSTSRLVGMLNDIPLDGVQGIMTTTKVRSVIQRYVQSTKNSRAEVGLGCTQPNARNASPPKSKTRGLIGRPEVACPGDTDQAMCATVASAIGKVLPSLSE
jgi:hypothetical protein